jgi:predicted DNA-binding transcriptional regulator YafY
MPVNRNALIRYRTLDTCLRNRYRKWTLEALIQACSDALYEYEGIDKGVSRRTIQADLQMMRSDKLGYNAPIVVIDKKYYAYEDPAYTITNIPLTDQDLGRLTEVVEILKQFKGFSHFQEVGVMVQKLENKIYTEKTKKRSVIDFEKNDGLAGLEHLETIYQAIIKKQVLQLEYQSFKAKTANTFFFHPYLLKEYRNRWFVLGIKKESQPVVTLALDRIKNIQVCEECYIENTILDPADFYKNVIGVTVSEGLRPQQVKLFVDISNAPYVLTKPLHHSQQLLEQTETGVIISICVQLNYELEREILGFGECIKVLSPEKLQKRIQERSKKLTALYTDDGNKTKQADMDNNQ